MTHYTQEDLDDDWEFKFVRSPTGAFRKIDVLEALLEEEAKFGWVLLEKFDAGRIRLKRPRSARARDHRYISQGEDPYRTHYGLSQQQIAVRVLLFSLGSILLVAGIIFLILG